MIACSGGKLNTGSRGSITDRERITLREKADTLSVSTHTLRNWKRRRESLNDGAEGLTSRANKLNSRRSILPRELLKEKENLSRMKGLCSRLRDESLSIEGALLLFVLDLLELKGLLECPRNEDSQSQPQSQPRASGRTAARKTTTLRGNEPRADRDAEKPGLSLEERLRSAETAPALKEELLRFLNTLPDADREKIVPSQLMDRKEGKALCREYDLPGLVYQSLRDEGSRSRGGSWFTPTAVIDAMLGPYLKESRLLFDPCCGSGLFLCRFAEKKGSVDAVGGMDRDPLAVFLARINLYLRFPCPESLKAVREGDSLKGPGWQLPEKSLVATNPPWGAHLPERDKRELESLYPEIRSGETASYFLLRTIRELPEGSAGSFLLPHSLLYVRTHRDIRERLLAEAPPREIRDWGRLFRGVYSEVISCSFRGGGRGRKLLVLPGKERIPLSRFRRNGDRILNIHCSCEEQALIDKICKGRLRPLPPDCRWLLGVVTGDNGRFVTSRPEREGRPLLTGRELRPFSADPVNKWLLGDERTLQQSRRPEEYDSPKLVYRFIGERPVFVLDRQGLITLNSANSLIPPESENLEEMVFWYNSALFRFLWYKQYRSVKMLRHQLEALPLPRWDKEERKELLMLVQKGEKLQDMPSEGEHLVFRHFGLNPKEIRLVLES